MKPLTFEELKPDMQLPELEKPPVDRVQLVKYAGSSGDFNPLHYSDEFAKTAGLNSVIAHGMLSMGFLGQYVRALVGTYADIKQIGVRFGKMTFPGDILTCKGKVVSVEQTEEGKIAKFEIACVKQNGDVVTSGNATVKYFD